jgi:hypothetical protein
MLQGVLPTCSTGRPSASRTLARSIPRALDRWHLFRIGPPRVILGAHKVRYRLSSFDAWVRSREVVGPQYE